jgi:type IV pilus assembly protein PilO
MAKEAALARLPMPARIGVSAGLLLLVAVAYWVVFYGDISSQIAAAEKQEQQLRGDLAEAQKSQIKYQKDLAELADRKQRQRELNKILPKETEYPAFLSSIQTVANVTGVSLSAWTPQGEVQEKYYAKIPMRLEVTGRYHQIAKFFYAVGQLDRIINMENIHITEPVAQGEDITVKVQVLATAFRANKEGDEAPKGDKRGRAASRKGKR